MFTSGNCVQTIPKIASSAPRIADGIVGRNRNIRKSTKPFGELRVFLLPWKKDGRTMRQDETERIDAEIARARRALEEGNPGMARVCCRRAAGEALHALAEALPGQASYGNNAMIRLEGLSKEPSAPETVRAAALRLRSKQHEEGMRPVSQEPLDDLNVILAWVRERIP
ncbi:MAG: hypothetical protein IPP94_03950 [Ignavibacteria bacterium]|nr:hypothetical protein [Ignavibacteria bacterium]